MSGSGNSFGPNALGGAGNGFGPNRSSSVASSGGSQGPINPATLSPAFWLQHGVGVTHIAGKVTAWLDSSGSGDANKNATGTGTGVARPTYNAADSAWNNLPTVSLNSSLAEYLYTGTWAAPLVAPFTIILLGQSDEGAEQALYDDVTTFVNVANYWSSPEIVTISDAGTIGYNNLDTVNLFQSPCMLTSVFGGLANSNTYLNALGSGYGNTQTGLSLGGIALGSFGGTQLGQDTMNGKVFEMVIIPKALTPAQVYGIYLYYQSLLGGIL